MVKREEVEVLLRAATMGESVFPIAVSYVALAELCRTWLAVDSAPVIAAQTAERAMFEANQMPMPGYGDPIKLVLVPEAGGGEG